MKHRRTPLIILLLVGVYSCFSGRQITVPSAPSRAFHSFEKRLVSRPIESAHFDEKGPFRITEHKNYRISLSPTQSVLTDTFIAQSAGVAPLIIFVHGNNSSKEAHRAQAEHLASWGFHTMTLQLIKRGAWLENGETVGNLVTLIHRWPSLVSQKIDAEKIILVGHSFGGSAVTVAAGSGAPVQGLILLDPAVFSPEIESAMTKVAAPVMILGADKNIYRSRKRKLFYLRIPTEVGEVSVAGATHDDAQYPSMFALSALGVDPYTSAEPRRQFLRAITATALSLSASRSLEFAWQALADDMEAGRLVDARRKGTAEIDNNLFR